MIGSYQSGSQGLQRAKIGHRPGDPIQSSGNRGEDVCGYVRSVGHAAQQPDFHQTADVVHAGRVQRLQPGVGAQVAAVPHSLKVRCSFYPEK